MRWHRFTSNCPKKKSLCSKNRMFHMRWSDSTEVGPRTAGCAWRLVALFSFAHGGKDGHPFPVPLRVYHETIRRLGRAIQLAYLGTAERLGALKGLDGQARQLERLAAAGSVPPRSRW